MNRGRGSKRDARLAFSCLWLVSWYKCQYLIGWNNWLTDVGLADLPRGDNEEKFNPWNVLSKWADSINKCRHDHRLTLNQLTICTKTKPFYQFIKNIKYLLYFIFWIFNKSLQFDGASNEMINYDKLNWVP